MSAWCCDEASSGCSCPPKTVNCCTTTVQTGCATNNDTSQSNCCTSKFAQFCNGRGSLSPAKEPQRKTCCRPLSPCSMPACPPRKPACKTKKVTCRPICVPVPPVFILCDESRNKPTSRLQNVNVTEELCYYAKKEPVCQFDCYNVCNGCGGMDYMPNCCCCCCDLPTESEPVKYTRRQCFDFADPKQCKQKCADWTAQKCRASNPFDDFPVGKNPTPSKLKADICSNDANECPCRRRKKNRKNDLETGVYYYSKSKGCLVPQCQLKPPTTRIEVTEIPIPPPCPCACAAQQNPQPCACTEEAACQPTACQPMMPYANPLYGCFNPCNPCYPSNPFNPCNPCIQFNGCNPCQPMGGMGCFGGMPMCGGTGPGVIPLCIPSCAQYAPPAQPPSSWPPRDHDRGRKKKKKKSAGYETSIDTLSNTATTKTLSPSPKQRKQKSLYTGSATP